MSPRLGSWGCLSDLTGPQGDVGIPTQGVGDNHGLLLRVLLCGIHALFSSRGSEPIQYVSVYVYLHFTQTHTCTHVLKGNLSHWFVFCMYFSSWLGAGSLFPSDPKLSFQFSSACVPGKRWHVLCGILLLFLSLNFL